MLHLLTKGKGLHLMLYIVKSERNKGNSRGLCESEFRDSASFDTMDWAQEETDCGLPRGVIIIIDP